MKGAHVPVSGINSGFGFGLGDGVRAYKAHAKASRGRCLRGGRRRIGNHLGCVLVRGGGSCVHLEWESTVIGIAPR